MKRRAIPKNLAVLAAIGAIFVSGVLLLQSVKADSWSWTSAAPVVESQDEVNPASNWRDQCQAKFNGTQSVVEVDGIDDPATVKTDCQIAEGDNFQLYTITGNSIAIKYGGDTHARLVAGIVCSYSCVYMPSRDIFIKLDSYNTYGNGKLVIYKNFVKSLIQKTLFLPNLTTETYYMAKDQPDEVLNDSFNEDQGAAFMKHIQRSSNDKWLMIEVVGAGLFRMDMDSRQLIKFSDWRTDYWYAGPMMEINMTDDGQRIAVFGTNTVNTIYEITPGCGNIMPPHPTYTDMWQNQTVRCPELPLFAPLNNPDNAPYMQGMREALQPQFSDDGGEISFYTYPGSNSTASPRYVLLKATDYAGPKPLDYLALGDSISSGEGDTEINTLTNNKYYRDHTDQEENESINQPREKCHLSTRSYPYYLASWMNLEQSAWNSVACSGAGALDVYGFGTPSYDGQEKGGPFPWSNSSIPRLQGYATIANLQTVALNEFIPGRIGQIKFVRKYKPKVITLTMGANDIGFAGKLQECVLPDKFGIPFTCNTATTEKASFASTIQGQYDNLVLLYRQLYEASGRQAKIYVVGYPRLISDAEPAQCGPNIGSLDLTERVLIVEATNFMNTVIEHAANAAGVKYVDISDSLDGGRLCDDGQKYVTGIAFSGKNEVQESFHPNDFGHIKMTQKIKTKVDNESLIVHNFCPDDFSLICPSTSGNQYKPEIPAYFGVPTTRAVSKKIAPSSIVKGSVVNLTFDKYQSLPGGSWQGTVHSDPIDLGQFTANSDGSLNVSITVPASIPPGPHILILTGKTYSGDPIEYTQDIFIKGSDTNDIDENGVPDSQQPCGPFMIAANSDIDADGVDDACDPSIGEAPAPSPSPTPTPSPTPSPVPKPQPSPLSHILENILHAVAVVIHAVINLLTKLLNF